MGIFDAIGSILDVAKPLVGIAGQVLGGSGKDSAGARTQETLSGKSKSAARIAAHQKFVTGFIDESVDIKSRHNVPTVTNNASEIIKAALAGGGDLSPEHKNSVEGLISRLQQAQQRA
tara:strand:- start:42 stop:395 length:354 start_codon:yes stop_codon:yes gene_type:complete